MQQPPTQAQDGKGAGREGAGRELRSDAEHLGNKAANRLHSEVDNRKSEAVNQAHSVSTAIEKTAGNLDDSAPDWLKSAFRQGAQKIQQFADSIEQKDSRQLMSDAQGFARDNPGTFLAACAGVGFAAARIFKAGGEQQDGQRGQSSWDRQDQSSGAQPEFRSPASRAGTRANAPGEVV